MVSGNENLRNLTIVPDSRSGVLRILQHAIEMAFVFKAFRVCQNTGHHTANCIRHCHGSNFAAGQHKVTQGNLFINALIDETLIDALIMTADQNQIFHLAQTNGICLPKGMTARRQINGVHRATCFVADSLPASIQWVRCHDSTTSAAVGIVVHLILLVGSVVTNLMGFNADESTLLSTAENTLRQNITQRLRKKRQNINSHRYASLQ